MTDRKLQALRNLAERPGTEAEGQLARELLAKLEKSPGETRRDAFDRFSDYLRTGSLDDLAAAVGHKTCDCGNRVPTFTQCANIEGHHRIKLEIRARFPRGIRVYYNRWAYSPNCQGRVIGYSATQWNWVRIKFDHLKNPRSVPVYSENGWHLSTIPLTKEQMKPLRGGMENIDGGGIGVLQAREER